MTLKEKSLIRKAINRLCDDDGWQDGIDILKKLINPDYVNIFEGCKIIKYNDIGELQKYEEK